MKNVDSDLGRGVCIYASKELSVSEITLETNFEEHLCLSIKLKNSDKLIFWNIYRSPNSGTENNNFLLDLFDNIQNHGASHVLLVGDFNYPNINWESGETNGPEGNPGQLLRDKIQDCFWTQKVNQLTRRRGSDRPSILDLVITNEEDFVEEINFSSPLGNSDHCLINFTFKCYIDPPNVKTKKFFMNKANFGSLKEKLNLDWTAKLEQINDVNSMWSTFEQIVNAAQNDCVPNKYVWRSNKRHPVPLDPSTVAEIKKKHRSWTRYMETNDEGKLRAYKKVRNKLRNITRRSRRKVELSIAKNVKDQPKKFWSYIKSKTKVHSSIPELEERRDGTSVKAKTDEEKAEMLGNFFSRVLIADENDSY